MATNANLSERVTTSFDHETYETLSQLAKQNNVSISWIVRHAVGELLARHQEDGQQLLLEFERRRA